MTARDSPIALTRDLRASATELLAKLDGTRFTLPTGHPVTVDEMFTEHVREPLRAMLETSAPEQASLTEALAAVLADHHMGRWSDGTVSCAGCRDRYEAETRDEWNAATTERREEMRQHHMDTYVMPGWTMWDYEEHVAAALAAVIIKKEQSA